MIEFRKLTTDDYPTLLDWLQRPHVKQYWDDGDDTLYKVAKHYALNSISATYFIAMKDQQDVGFYQYCSGEKSCFGIDMFLANTHQLSKGLGTEFLNTFCNIVIESENCHSLSVDPHPDNERAIRCYKKCGFEYVAKLSNEKTYLMKKIIYAQG